MTDKPQSDPQSGPQPAARPERIAKVMARAGLASRREAERMILEGRVTVNGQQIASPALDVTATDRIRVDGKPIEAPQETRLWLYYKPLGLVTSNADEKGRQTVFDALPRDLPRVMTVGRLDLNSEGLLLLTNDGELKRRLELPATGWLRRYRVRVNGQPNDMTFAPLRRGVTIDGEEFAPMEINLDSQQGANAWLTVGIREGRNREIRRAMAHVGLIVNRLIRIGYGPFKLTGLEENEVREVKRKVLRDQLGGLLTGETEEKPRSFRERGAARTDGARKDGPRSAGRDGSRDETRPRRPAPRGEGGAESGHIPRREDVARKPFARREDGERKPFARREDGARPFAKREDGERKPFARRPEGEGKPARDAKPFGKGPRGGQPGFKGGAKAAEGERSFKPRGEAGFKPKGQSQGQGKPGRASQTGKPGAKPGAKPAAPKTSRAPGKGARPEGKGPRRG